MSRRTRASGCARPRLAGWSATCWLPPSRISSRLVSRPRWRCELDGVEEGRENWVKTLKRFYGPFEKRLGEAKKKMPEVKRKGLETDLKCELDGGTMVIKWGRNGEFLACSNYPKCTNTNEFKRDDQGNVIPQESTAPAIDRRGLREVRQADGAPALALRRVPRMLGLSRLRRHQAHTRRAGEHRRRLPGLQGRRNPRTAQPARQNLFRLRPLSEVQVRELGSRRARIHVPIADPPTWSRKSPSATALDGNARTRNAAISSRPRRRPRQPWRMSRPHRRSLGSAASSAVRFCACARQGPGMGRGLRDRLACFLDQKRSFSQTRDISDSPRRLPCADNS